MADFPVNSIDFVVTHDEVVLTVGQEYDLAPDLIGITESVFIGRENFIERPADMIGITDYAILSFTGITALDTIGITDKTAWILGPEYDYPPDLISIIDSVTVTLNQGGVVLNDASAVFLGTIAATKVYVGEYLVWP